MCTGTFFSRIFRLSVALMLMANGPVAQAVSSGEAREITFSSLADGILFMRFPAATR